MKWSVYRLHRVVQNSTILWVICHDFMLISAYTFVMHWTLMVSIITNVDIPGFLRLL